MPNLLLTCAFVVSGCSEQYELKADVYFEVKSKIESEKIITESLEEYFRDQQIDLKIYDENMFLKKYIFINSGGQILVTHHTSPTFDEIEIALYTSTRKSSNNNREIKILKDKLQLIKKGFEKSPNFSRYTSD